MILLVGGGNDDRSRDGERDGEQAYASTVSQQL
jgi:hypothetical protein